MSTKIIPVIHYADDAQAMRNAERSFDANCDGVFLIHMEGQNQLLPKPAQAIKQRWPDKLVGINALGTEPSFVVAANIHHGLDMTWTDEQVTHSAGPWDEAALIRAELDADRKHLVFVGVAFKHQRAEPDPAVAARKALEFGFIPTTSGVATGISAESTAIAALRGALGDGARLAIASGITPENVTQFAPNLTHILVATGVSSSFHEFDYMKLCALRTICDGAIPA